jgi:opacity protein-like surface antigen
LELTLMQASGFGLTGSRDTETGQSVDPMVGVGAAWHLPGSVTLRAEYTRFIDVGDKDKTGEINIDLFNVGVTYSFR